MNLRKIIIGVTLLLLIMQPSFVLAKIYNDPLNNNLWYSNALRMNQVWDYSQGEGIIVAVIDSGVDTDHPDLLNKIWINQKEISGDNIDNDNNGYIDDVKGWDFFDSDNDPKPEPMAQTGNCERRNNCDYSAFYHGTAISGIFGAETDNAFGISGLAPKSRIMVLRVLDSTGSGSSGDVISAVDYAINNGAKVINMSFVGLSDDVVMTQSIERAFNRGVAVVVAAGNKEGTTQIDLDVSPRYPICSVGSKGQKILLGVGSLGQDYVLSDFSNYGSTCVDFLAPGDNIFGAVPNEPELGFNDYFSGGFRGTSLSAPMVSGAVALIRSHSPNLSVSQVFQLIKQNAQNISANNPGFETKIGSGALDILNVFYNIGSVAPTPTPTPTPTPNPMTPVVGLSFGDIFKVSGIDSVYYYGNDGKRYVFPDTGTFFSWYIDFSLVKTVQVETSSQIPLGGVVTYRPGVQMVKVATDPKVYAVDTNGVLRWVTSESLAIELYGPNWIHNVRDLSDAFVASYFFGANINQSIDFDPVSVIGASKTINQDKAL